MAGSTAVEHEVTTMQKLQHLAALLSTALLAFALAGCGGASGPGVDDLSVDGHLLDVPDGSTTDVGFFDAEAEAQPEPQLPDEVVGEIPPVDAEIDAAEPEAPIEVVEVDVPPEVLEVPPGTPCEDDTTCGSKTCLNHLCVAACGLGCDEGWDCLVNEGKGYCFPPDSFVCHLCHDDQDCAGDLVEVPYRCVPQDGYKVCLHTCKAHAECPSSECVTPPDLPGAKVCVTHGCTCTATDTLGAAEGECFLLNEWGTCWGLAQCAADGQRSCAAVEPAREFCNGADDNCDGQTDEGYPDENVDGVADCANLTDDPDDDGISASGDNCPTVWNPWQENMDLDGWGDACDPDVDGDDVENEADCEPGNPLAYPGAEERCNGIDDDCDLHVDEGFPDANGDGVPDCGLTQDADFDGILDFQDNCAAVPNPNQHDLDQDDLGDACDPNIDGDPFLNPDDCDDFDADVYPGATESCNGKDDDCNGKTDEGYKDSDGDDQADCIDADDDNDELPDASDNCPLKGNPDQIDTDGDGTGNACDSDIDGDNVKNSSDNCPEVKNVDQKDIDSDGAGDVCDVDRDGDLIENPYDNCPDALNPGQENLDGDSLGDACDPDIDGDGSIPPNDCDDRDATVSPSAEEVCDGVDNNCDDWADSDPNLSGCDTYFYDNDADGFGSQATQCLCGPSSTFTATVGGDCQDNDKKINPSATEVCDTVDNNCSGKNNEGFPDTDNDGNANCVDYDDDGDGILDGVDNCPLVQNPAQTDTDHDGHGDACDGDIDNDGTPDGSDCAPEDPSIHPGATETCNTRDDDCDGATDEAGASGCVPYFVDGDGDGYGAGASSCRCAAGGAYTVKNGGDCADTIDTVHPNADEACNGVDDDCDVAIDEGCDDDGDGYCASGSPLVGSPEACPNGGGDCDDTLASVHPGGVETCNGRDDDCNDAADDGCDDDGDGYCDVSMVFLSSASCPMGPGDCNDDSPVVNPGAYDTPDLSFRDANCDGLDGQGGQAVFVDAVSGTAAGSGAADDPVDTIQGGILKAQAFGVREVLVAGGVYDGPVSLVGGIGVFGGYGGVIDGWDVRETTRVTEIKGSSPGVTVANLFYPTTLQLVSVTAEADTSAEGNGSSVALFVRNAGTYLTVEGCTLTASDGLDGAPGVAGTAGGVGSAGGAGANGCQQNCNWPGGGTGGGSACGRTGGAGGASGSADDAGKGANGGAGTVANQGGGPGGTGGNNASGGKYSNGSASIGANGGAGSQGTGGANGAAAAAAGWLDGAGWHRSSGTSGIDGGHGHGGGGGGGGGGFSVDWESDDLFGGGGGGGGGAGCGGKAGTGGASGGSSFAVVIVASSPVLKGNVLTTGKGGNGGAGKAGGAGGAGAAGGPGGAQAHAWNVNSGPGATGGAGGNGGKGGDGAGGCGGNSVGIVHDGSSVPTVQGNTIHVGAAGVPGGGGNATNAGCPGAAAEVSTL